MQVLTAAANGEVVIFLTLDDDLVPEVRPIATDGFVGVSLVDPDTGKVLAFSVRAA